MLNLTSINILKLFSAVSLIVILAACHSSNNDDVAVFDPTTAPQNVQVVSGDGDSFEVQNTISWTRDFTNPDYVVYWRNTPGVTENDPVVVPIDDTDDGFTFVTHSGIEVVAGSPYYYRVKAMSGGESSPLSAEVTGTPQQSMTGNALNDVAWNGMDSLVTVGDAGVILSSPNGMADGWNDVSDVLTTPESLTGVTWESVNNQFLIVGAGLTVLTGDGINTWNREDLGNLGMTTDLEDVAWLGTEYIAVGKNGIIITSPDGSDWIDQSPVLNVQGTTLNGVASDGNIIVVVGNNGIILTSSDDGITWSETTNGNNSLNDITWDGNQFGIVGSNDTILTSTDGDTWIPLAPGTSSIAFIAASQWDSSIPANPVLGAVGSAGTFVVSLDSVNWFSIHTGADTGLLSGITWVDDGVTPPYFVIVGNDGTVLTSQLQ